MVPVKRETISQLCTECLPLLAAVSGGRSCEEDFIRRPACFSVPDEKSDIL